MLGTSSTLVETVSINYEDFNESFLTCGTCLCMYDGGEHTPKLLPCSHTVCLHCLTRIAASQTRDNGTFRCPICRELITIPRGGVAALPPSFLVNQLLDLMSRQRREVIPKCSVHINQELLFCETCDAVFCNLCTGSGHHGQSGAVAPSADHTIIPFSIAIKRMSEILLYKANECIAKLKEAQDTVRGELQRLDSATERSIEQVNTTMGEVAAMVEARRQELLTSVTTRADEKRKVLEEQLAIIESEKSKVERDCDGLQYQVEVRNITQRVASLADKLEAAATLSEPLENSFLTCEFSHNEALSVLPQHLKRLGRIRASTTFPSLSTWEMENTTIVANLYSTVLLHTVDYRGDPRKTGGDPVTATLVKEPKDSSPPVVVTVNDFEDGSYKLNFRPKLPGSYHLNIKIFDRLLRDCPIKVEVTDHNNPVKSFGHRGNGRDCFCQPVAIAIDRDTDTIYVVDTGNCRIKVLSKDLEFIKHIENEALEGRSCTGIDVCKTGIVIVNWRSKFVTTMDLSGNTLSEFSHNEFLEPIDVCVDREYGHYLVGDNRVFAVLVFEPTGRLLFKIGRPGTERGCINLISALCVSPNSILVSDARIQIFSPKGDIIEEIGEVIPNYRDRYGGLAVDEYNRIVAVRKGRYRNVVQVLSLPGGKLLSTIDSEDFKLRRTGGLVVTKDCHVVVVDLGNDCVRKYRYH